MQRRRVQSQEGIAGVVRPLVANQTGLTGPWFDSTAFRFTSFQVSILKSSRPFASPARSLYNSPLDVAAGGDMDGPTAARVGERVLHTQGRRSRTPQRRTAALPRPGRRTHQALYRLRAAAVRSAAHAVSRARAARRRAGTDRLPHRPRAFFRARI